MGALNGGLGVETGAGLLRRQIANVHFEGGFRGPQLSPPYNLEAISYREQKRHIKLFHIKLFPVAPVTGPPGRVSGRKDLCSLGSEDST